MLDGLAPYTRCLCAADAFQDLKGDTDNEAISWAKATGEFVPLTQNHRFSQRAGLLNAATALRGGSALKSDRSSGFEFVGVPKAPMGGGKANWFIQSYNKFGQIAIVTPTQPSNSPFVAELVRWMSTSAAKCKNPGVTAGPFVVNWEAGDEKLWEELLMTLNIPEAPDEQICCDKIAGLAQEAGAFDVRDWIERQRNIAGRKTIGSGEIRAQVKQIVHRRRAFGRPNEVRRIAMTVHQAKNREFESVIVLWPLKVVPNAEQQRRYLYNAITRAKRQVVVIVEDPKKCRLDTSLFAGRG